MEVVADGLPLHGGAQLAIDTTMVSLLHRDGTALRGLLARTESLGDGAETEGTNLSGARR